ncbi:hypothetical protein [Bosea sp. (in: a-proteobacteria)]|jgi:hypothetical protein|uniref:hypothetical protein n=1 Tax=Bosea sp. (in: a-proteobacteria) TaxID=1871050 RepID=UPI003569656C
MNQPAYSQCIASRCEGKPQARNQRKPRSETGQAPKNFSDRAEPRGHPAVTLRILRNRQTNAIVAASGLSSEAECADLHYSGQVKAVTRQRGSIGSFHYVDQRGSGPYNVNVEIDHLDAGQRAEIAPWLETVLALGQNVAFMAKACGAAGRMLYLDTLESAPEQPRPSLILSAPTGPVSQAAPAAAAAISNPFYGLWGRTPADCAVASGDEAPEDQDGVDYLFIGERSKWGTFHYCRILNVTGSGRERTYRLRCDFEGEDKAVVVNDRFALSGSNGEFLQVGKPGRKLTLCARTTPRWISDASKRLLNVGEGQ